MFPERGREPCPGVCDSVTVWWPLQDCPEAVLCVHGEGEQLPGRDGGRQGGGHVWPRGQRPLHRLVLQGELPHKVSCPTR